MKVLIFSFLLACASAQWYPFSGYHGGYYGYPAYHGSRYQSQDVFGQTSYGYAYPGQAASNFQDAAGNQIGSYAYINPAGKEVRVSYVADALGFRVASNDLPVAVQDTPEVAAAKIQLANLQRAAPSRAKRQIAVLPTQQFVNDLHYRSVDLNQDGQPDAPVYSAYRSWPYAALPYSTPYSLGYPLATPAVPAVHAVHAVHAVPAVTHFRGKRQAVYPHQQFVNDLHYRSVDLNQDGQPDAPVYSALPYTTLPYAAQHVAAPFVTRTAFTTPYAFNHGYYGTFPYAG